MQQPCSRCGYISDRPARFCRQCGSALFNETEASSATTRNYAPQQAQPLYRGQPETYSPYTPGRYDEQTPDTSPFYRAPIAPQYQVPEQKSFNWGKWILIGLLGFLLISGVAVGSVIYLLRSPNEIRPTIGEIPDIPSIPHPPDVPVVQPPLPPEAPAPSGSDNYRYPDAKITKSYKDGMNEVTQMVTDDDLDEVKKYYDEKFKNSPVDIKAEEGQKIVFTKLGNPLLVITVQADKADEDKTEITLVRTNLQIKIPPLKFETR